jgi:hypothetical protein
VNAENSQIDRHKLTLVVPLVSRTPSPGLVHATPPIQLNMQHSNVS